MWCFRAVYLNKIVFIGETNIKIAYTDKKISFFLGPMKQYIVIYYNLVKVPQLERLALFFVCVCVWSFCANSLGFPSGFPVSSFLLKHASRGGRLCCIARRYECVCRLPWDSGSPVFLGSEATATLLTQQVTTYSWYNHIFLVFDAINLLKKMCAHVLHFPFVMCCDKIFTDFKQRKRT